MSILLNSEGRLRGGWCFLAFVALYLIALFSVGSLAQFYLSQFVNALFGAANGAQNAADAGQTYALIIAQQLVFRFILMATALAVGRFCAKVFEDLPFRSLGASPQRGWLKDIFVGAAIGAASLLFCAALVTVFGGFRFALNMTNAARAASSLQTISATLAGAGVLFFVAAFAEETIFRGYPLQTLLRSIPAPLALLPTSFLFALVHLDNPHVAPAFTFLNTMLAGVWLAVCYLRARNLWLPLGAHFAWNFTQGALLGIPVSGITQVAPAPLLRATDAGPAWLTGGSYGVEGGAACTITLSLSIIFLWRTRPLKAQDETMILSEREKDAETNQPSVFKRD